MFLKDIFQTLRTSGVKSLIIFVDHIRHYLWLINTLIQEMTSTTDWALTKDLRISKIYFFNLSFFILKGEVRKFLQVRILSKKADRNKFAMFKTISLFYLSLSV